MEKQQELKQCRADASVQLEETLSRVPVRILTKFPRSYNFSLVAIVLRVLVEDICPSGYHRRRIAFGE